MSTLPVPPEQWITVPVPALVTAETFAAVQERLRTNQHLARRNGRHHYLLRGLVSCGTCRLSCTGRMMRAADSYRYYVCRGKLPAVTSSREARCPARLTPAAQFDALVWADVCQVLQQPDLVRQALARAQAGAWVPEELRRRRARLRAVRASLSRQQDRLLEAYLADVLDLATFEHSQVGRLRSSRRWEDVPTPAQSGARADRCPCATVGPCTTTAALPRRQTRSKATIRLSRRQRISPEARMMQYVEGCALARHDIVTSISNPRTGPSRRARTRSRKDELA